MIESGRGMDADRGEVGLLGGSLLGSQGSGSVMNKYYGLFLFTASYVFGELGHFLIGTTSRPMAQDIGFGDKSCLRKEEDVHADCEGITEAENLLSWNGSSVCEWNYNGLGMEYQILAGPSFIGVFTISCVVIGVMADRTNRIVLLAACTAAFGCSVFLLGFAQYYWQLALLRMTLAAGEAGCSPLSTGLISDLFPQGNRGMAMGIFTWGIYLGYGLSYAIGNYVTSLNLFDEGWRFSYYISGAPALLIAALMLLTASDPFRHNVSKLQRPENLDLAETKAQENLPKLSAWRVFFSPKVLLLCLAACVRHTAGFCWSYNTQLYFQTYYPTFDLGWWLTGVSIGSGTFGVVLGGVVADGVAKRVGIRARVAVLAASQVAAVPFAAGTLYFPPPYAFVSLIGAYLFAEMWFGVLFAILVELVPVNIRSTTVGIFLFVMNNIGGNFPVLVDPLSKAIGYREALYFYYPGLYFLSGILFFACIFLHQRR